MNFGRLSCCRPVGPERIDGMVKWDYGYFCLHLIGARWIPGDFYCENVSVGKIPQICRDLSYLSLWKEE